MPELPEVETIRNNLRIGGADQPGLVGRKVAAVQVLWERTLAFPAPGEFQDRVVGQAIQDIQRRGKYLVFRLSQDSMLFHLRMSGDLIVENIATPPAKHDRLIVDFEDGPRLAFLDPRKFGRVWFTNTPDEILGGLGPEPLDPLFTPQEFYERLQAKQRRLKPLLMDQAFLAGLGNIYTDEALHLAHLHPLRVSNLLTRAESERLYASIRQVLQEGIRRNGTTIDWVYRGGDFQNYLRVYQRTGEPCPECGTTIQRIIVGQRSSHFCPTCQLETGETQ